MASSSSLYSLCSSFHSWRQQLIPNFNSKSPAISMPVSRNARIRVKFRIRAGYSKRPLDTPGAYELIDEESGEKVIVWGGVDGDVPTPSKQVLTWDPNKPSSSAKRNVRGNELLSVGHDNVNSSITTPKLSKGFGRLKALKIRNVATKALRKKQKTNEPMYEEPDIHDDDDGGDDDIVSLNRRSTFVKRKNNLSVKSGVDLLMDQQLSLKPFETDRNLTYAGSSVSATHSNIWSNRESRRSSRGESKDTKPNRKYNVGSEFFSRKSFRELGCCDEMIETLRAQDFVRPSHIQADNQIREATVGREMAESLWRGLVSKSYNTAFNGLSQGIGW